jgi:ankyrin repeat protein
MINCMSGNIDFIKKYFNHKKEYECINKKFLDVNSKNINGASLIHTAIANFQVDIVKYLVLELGANIELKNPYYGTPIFTSCEGKSMIILKFLVERGVNIENRNKIKETPIIYPCRKNNIKAVRYLISKGVDYNVKTPQGNRIFDYTGNYTENIKKLINKIESKNCNIKSVKR